jgi:hypothetical protein
VRRREPLTPEQVARYRRNGWLPREPAQIDRTPRDELTTSTITPWLPPTMPDEGNEVLGLDGLTAAFADLGDHRNDIQVIAEQAYDAGYPISLKQLCSERRYYIASGLITLYRTCAAKPVMDDPAGQAGELARCFVAHIADDEGAQQPGIPLGAVAGSLDATAAKAFCELAEAFEQGRLALMFTMGGRMYLPEDPDPAPVVVADDDPFAP